MANFLYRFIDRASAYIGEVLALSYFNELFTTYNSTLPIDTENQVAYFFPKDVVDEAGGGVDSALIGIANKNGEFQELGSIGVPNGGEIVNLNIGDKNVEAVLFSPVPQGASSFNFANNSYSNKTAFYNYISPKVTGINSINDILNFSSAGAIVYFDLVNPIDIIANGFENDNVLYAISDSSGAIQTIGISAFRNSSLISIIAPNCISASNYAFKGCEILMTATLDSLQLLGVEAFYGCETITTFSFPNCNTISEATFANCTGATTISLPLISVIPNSAFLNCSSCTSFTLSNAETVGNSSFVNCNSVTSLSLPLVVEVGDNAFEAMASVNSILIPNLETAGIRAFADCSLITSFAYPKLNIAGNECFSNCSNAITMTLFTVLHPTAYAGTVGDSCFVNCTALIAADFPFVQTLGNFAFESCTNLEDIRLANATGIGSGAFIDCSSCTYIDISNAGTCGATLGNNNVFSGCTFAGLSIYINTSIMADADITDADLAGANIIV